MNNFDRQRPDQEPVNRGPAPLVEPQPKTRVGGLELNNAGLICYIPICAIGLIGSIVFLATEDKGNKFLRFHAIQSIIFSVAFVLVGNIINIGLGIIISMPFMHWLAFLPSAVWGVLTIVFIWQCVVVGLNAHKGGMERIPYIGDFADSIS